MHIYIYIVSSYFFALRSLFVLIFAARRHSSGKEGRLSSIIFLSSFWGTQSGMKFITYILPLKGLFTPSSIMGCGYLHGEVAGTLLQPSITAYPVRESWGIWHTHCPKLTRFLVLPGWDNGRTSKTPLDCCGYLIHAMDYQVATVDDHEIECNLQIRGLNQVRSCESFNCLALRRPSVDSLQSTSHIWTHY